MVGIFLLPIGPLTKKASADAGDFSAIVTSNGVTSGSVNVKVVLKSEKDGAYGRYLYANLVNGVDSKSGFEMEISSDKDFSDIVNYFHATWGDLGYVNNAGGLQQGDEVYINPAADKAGRSETLNATFGELKASTPYWIRFTEQDGPFSSYQSISNTVTFETLQVGDGTTPAPSSNIENPDNFDFKCLNLSDGFSMSGCISSFLYYALFRPASAIAELVGKVLDFFVYYSTNSKSYSSLFISKGWGTIRDVANIFFIVALLYLAIKTILDLGGASTKKLLSTIIIVALLINFSLFFTEVIIDASNILAKVFYNNIDSKYEDKTPAKGAEGEKSISVGLIDKFNPQNIVSKSVYDSDGGHTQFIFITLLATALILYTAYIFFTVALLFVGRVVSLWISMIFAPIAFASYTIPFDIPGLGHKEWWTSLLQNAFLAPLFIFMLYIIIMFAGFLSTIVTYPDSAGLTQKIMATFIPFIILVGLLSKAKTMAVQYSGEIGKTMMSGTKMIGGLALGAITGGAAMAMRGTLGKLASRTLGGQKGVDLKQKSQENTFGGFMARRQLDALQMGSRASFDARRTAAGKAFSKESGMNLESSKGIGLGSKEGGYEKFKADTVAKRQKRAESLKVGFNEDLNKELREHQENLQELKTLTNADITKVDKDLKDAAERQSEVSKMSDANSNKKKLQDLYSTKLEMLRAQKTAIKTGESFAGTYQNEDGSIGTITQKALYIEKGGKRITLKAVKGKSEGAEENVVNQENKIATENANRLNKEAERLSKDSLFRDKEISEEASHKLRMGAQAEENKKK